MKRREFIKNAAAGIGGLSVLGASGQGAAAGKKPLRVALIGCGGRGCGELLPELCKERVVALADADRRCIEASLAKVGSIGRLMFGPSTSAWPHTHIAH